MSRTKRGLHALHPLSAFLYYVGGAVFIMAGQHPVFAACTFVLVFVLNGIQDHFAALKKWGRWYAAAAFLIVILTPAFNRRGTHILFYFRDNPVLLEGVIQGVIAALSLLALLFLFVSFNQVITSEKFLFLFARVVPQWALLAMLTMRFVPLFQRRLHDIGLVQKTKGMSVKKGGFLSRIESAMKLLHILLEWSLEEALQTADSMKARGYGIERRSRYSPYAFSAIDAVVLALTAAGGVCAIFGYALGDTVLTTSPVLEPVLLSGREWFYFSVYLFYFAFPMMIEGRERWRWHFSKSTK